MRNDVTIGGCFPHRRDGGDQRVVPSEHERARITARVLFIWGEGHRFGDPEIGRDFVRPFPDATLIVLPYTGDAPWMDDAGQAAHHVKRFLGTELVRERVRQYPVPEDHRMRLLDLRGRVEVHRP
jgi:pimeloyl-ACP methyl ester carboxylesterase